MFRLTLQLTQNFPHTLFNCQNTDVYEQKCFSACPIQCQCLVCLLWGPILKRNPHKELNMKIETNVRFRVVNTFKGKCGMMRGGEIKLKCL